jgi:hypothetical protein
MIVESSDVDPIDRLLKQKFHITTKHIPTEHPIKNLLQLIEAIKDRNHLYNPDDYLTDLSIMKTVFNAIKTQACCAETIITAFLQKTMYLEFDDYPDFNELAGIPIYLSYTQPCIHDIDVEDLFLHQFRYTYLCIDCFNEIAKQKTSFDTDTVAHFVMWCLDQPYFHNKPDFILICLQLLSNLLQICDFVKEYHFDLIFNVYANLMRDHNKKFLKTKTPLYKISDLHHQYLLDYPYGLMSYQYQLQIGFLDSILDVMSTIIQIYNKINLEWVQSIGFPWILTYTEYPSVIKTTVDTLNCLLETTDLIEQIPHDTILIILSYFPKNSELLGSILRFIYLTLFQSDQHIEFRLFDVYSELGILRKISSLFNEVDLQQSELLDIGNILCLFAKIKDDDYKFLNDLRLSKYHDKALYCDVNDTYFDFLLCLLSRKYGQNKEVYKERLNWIFNGKTMANDDHFLAPIVDDEILSMIWDKIEQYFIDGNRIVNDCVDFLLTWFNIARHDQSLGNTFWQETLFTLPVEPMKIAIQGELDLSDILDPKHRELASVILTMIEEWDKFEGDWMCDDIVNGVGDVGGGFLD